MQKWLLCETGCWSLPCMISFNSILQRFGLSKIVIYVQFIGPIKKQIFHTAPLSFHISVIVFGNGINIQEEYIKNSKFWHCLIFLPFNSKSVLPQSISFSQAGKQTIKLSYIIIMNKPIKLIVYMIVLFPVYWWQCCSEFNDSSLWCSIKCRSHTKRR